MMLSVSNDKMPNANVVSKSVERTEDRRKQSNNDRKQRPDDQRRRSKQRLG